MIANTATLSGFIAAALAGAGTLHTAQMDGHTRGADQQHARHAQDSVLQDVTRAVAVIRPTEGNDGVSGTIRFERVEDGVRVTALVRGLEPNSKHGFHAHEFGDATAADGTSAGGHYDPSGSGHHARPGTGDAHHAGDFGNLEANSEGVARYDRTFDGLSIAGSEAPVLGRAVIIHAQPDQFDQPTGSAGARIGIGVIGVANPEQFGKPLGR
ncbi:MAG: superoxide dismutase family protein [Phycisphaerales bacterium JB060]